MFIHHKPPAGLHAGHWGRAGNEVGMALTSCSLAATHQILYTQNQRLTTRQKQTNKQKNKTRLKNGQKLAATWKDLEIIILSEVRERQTSYDITYTWNPKYDTNELIYKTETDSQT